MRPGAIYIHQKRRKYLFFFISFFLPFLQYFLTVVYFNPLPFHRKVPSHPPLWTGNNTCIHIAVSYLSPCCLFHAWWFLPFVATSAYCLDYILMPMYNGGNEKGKGSWIFFVFILLIFYLLIYLLFIYLFIYFFFDLFIDTFVLLLCVNGKLWKDISLEH